MVGVITTNHATADALLEHARTFLEASEAENALLLGICASSRDTSPNDPEALWMSVDSDSGPVAVAVRTPPFNLVISRAPDLALAALADALAARDASLPGVTGPVNAALTFAELWSRARSVRVETTMAQGVYELTAVVPPARCAPGGLRKARADDVSRVGDWMAGFAADANLPVAEHEVFRRRASAFIAAGSVFLWEVEDEAVSMAMLQGPTPHGIRVSAVYTPKDLRGCGYASACVAALSAYALATGRRFCMLYTDLANPTSNGIYQRLGYVLIGESTMLAFHE
jgi:uncharacterized protein